MPDDVPLPDQGPVSSRLERIIEILRSFQKRKQMYVRPVDPPSVENFLHGFAVGCMAAGVELSHELLWAAQERRGWKQYGALGPVPQMRKRGMSDEAIMDELIEIEVLRLRLLCEGAGPET